VTEILDSLENEPNWEIGFAKPGDGAGIAEVQKTGWLATYPDPSIGFTKEDIDSLQLESPERIAKWESGIENQNEGKGIWVVRGEDKIIGYAVGEKTPEKQELKALYALPRYRGKKVGKALMDNTLVWFDPTRDIVVWVFSHNNTAINFYNRYDFEKSGNIDAPEINGKNIPILEMIRKAIPID